LNALLLALPLPLPPFIGSNALPSYAIIFIAVSMTEEDSIMIWLGYLASSISTASFAFFGALLVKHLGGWWQALFHGLGIAP
jgi:hypothetical protein